jgi:ribosomal protein S18 acetylase RimI-like enzyme
VVGLARRSFIYSRFHLDKAIPRETADTLKAEWVGNYFTGKRGDQMVVALVDGTIVGFLQLLYGRDKTVTIDLISVDASQRRKGIASDMIAYAEAECGDFKQIRVGTQIANVPSIRLYEKIGFRVTGAQYVFHYHHVPSPGHEGLGGAGQRR